ncbi:hypothetical protein KAH37_00785, partial [bacterium]|nr:hypothetical protein [bacterium]
MDFKRVFWVVLLVMMTVVASSCATKKQACSIDADCKTGDYCSESDECKPMAPTDFSVAFVDMQDPLTVFSEDRETNSPIDATVRLMQGNNPVSDGTVVSLKRWTKSTGDAAALVSAKTVNGIVRFVNLPVKYPYDRLTAFYQQNPEISTDTSLQYNEVDYTIYYIGKDEKKRPLDGTTFSAVDDFDPDTDGIQLHLIADLRGFLEKTAFSIATPDFDAKPLTTVAYNPPPENVIDYGILTFPHAPDIRLISSTSDGFSSEVMFHISESTLCTFSVDLKSNQLLGLKDDELSNNTTIDKNVVLSNFKNCPEDSVILVELWKTDASDKYNTVIGSLDAASVTVRLPFEASNNATDLTKAIFRVINDQSTTVGNYVVDGIIADMVAPSFVIAHPTNGQIYTQADDTDDVTPGIQIAFSGDAADAISTTVTMTTSINETVIDGPESRPVGTITIPTTLSTPLDGAVASFSVTDEAGNETVETATFSVVYDSRIDFTTICTKTDGEILNNMWLNRSDDTDGATAGLQCQVVVTVHDSVDADQVILTVDGVALPAQPLSTSNAATFAISAVDSASGIVLHAETAGSGTDKLSTEITVRIDTVAPVVILTNSLSLTDGDATPNNALDFTQACVDEVSCEFDNHVDGEAWSGWSTTAVASLTNLNSSAHIFHAKARDAAGNEGIETLFHWTVDSREPQTSITLSPTKTTNLDYAHFAFMADKSPITFECQLFKESVQIVPATGWDDCSAGTQNYFSLTNGSYEFRVRATDSLSNVESTPASFDWIVTQDLPVTTILTTNPVGAIVPNKTMVFTYESSIAESSFECQLLKDGAVEEDWTDCDSGTKSYSSLDDGSYLFKVKATTAYGEEEINPAQHGWSIDATKPLVTVSSKPPSVTGFAAAQFVFACEGEAAPCTFECALDGAVATACTSPQTTADLSEGAHTFVITAIDNAGNRSDVVTDQLDPHVNSIEWTYTISAALEVSITTQPNSVTNLDSATFEFVATRIAATFVCKLDSDAAVACTSPFNYNSLSDGNHTFTVTASEGGDNASASYSWNIDKTPPTITFSLTPANPTIETGASFAFSADETVIAFECKADSESWHACSSPTVYAAGTFGTNDTVSSHAFDVRASDTAGNEGSAHFEWDVDLRKPTILWTTPVPHPDGQVLVGPEDDKYIADDLLYAIDVVVTVEGAKVGSEIKVTGFHEPPGYTPVLITTAASKTYILQIGLQQGNYLLNDINIEVESLNGLKTSVAKAVVVVIDKPSIAWNSPSNGKVFLVGESSGIFRFNLWNSASDMTIELVRDDTDTVIGTAVTAGAHDTLEFVEIQATLPDSCESYKFYARFVDPVSGDMLYTDATDVKENRTVRSIGFDIHSPVIGEVTITGISDTDRYLNKNDNLNPIPDGVMQTDFTIALSDAEIPIDTKRTVTIFTNIGGGEVELINKNNIGDSALFEKLSFSESQHRVTVVAKDCNGNSASTTLDPFTVDTKPPVLTLSTPVGSFQPQLLVVADDPTLGTINSDDDFTGVTLRVDANEELENDATIVQKTYDYTGVIQNAPGDELPAATVTYGTTYLECALPNLTNSQHDFIVTVHDKAGNESILGDDPNDWFLVDTITPQAEITNLSDGDTVDTDAEPGTPGFQAEIIVNFTDINQLTKYELSTIPILSQGGAVDTARVTVVYSDWISGDETKSFVTKTSGGWWRLIVSVEATTSNKSETAPIDVFVDSPSPSLTLRKSYNYPQGDGDTLFGADTLNPAWLHSQDISCSGDNCDTDFEVWTNAPVGTNVDLVIDGGAPQTVPTIDGGNGASVALFDGVTLDTSLAQNVLTITVNSTTPRTDIRYIEVDKTNPTLTVINPTCTPLNTPCNIKPLADDGGTDEIELAEIGFGIEDAANTHSGSKIQFKADHQIVFQVEGAVDGYVAFAHDTHLSNKTVPIHFDAINSRYIVDFSSLLIEDNNSDGQTDLDLILTVTETPSGAFTTYMIKVHLDMATPVAVNTTGFVAT